MIVIRVFEIDGSCFYIVNERDELLWWYDVTDSNSFTRETTKLVERLISSVLGIKTGKECISIGMRFEWYEDWNGVL